jgi:hypothetical protein
MPSSKIADLYQQIEIKISEIKTLVAEILGPNADDLEVTATVNDLINDFEVWDVGGRGLENWRASDARLTSTAIDRLLRDRHELEEKLLHLMDE